MQELLLGVDMRAYKSGVRKLDAWHNRKGARRCACEPENAQVTVKGVRYGETVTFRGSGFYAGRNT